MQLLARHPSGRDQRFSDGVIDGEPLDYTAAHPVGPAVADMSEMEDRFSAPPQRQGESAATAVVLLLQGEDFVLRLGDCPPQGVLDPRAAGPVAARLVQSSRQRGKGSPAGLHPAITTVHAVGN